MTDKNEFSRPLTDEQLENTVGGEYYNPLYSVNKDDIDYLFEIGDTVEVSAGYGFGITVRSKITDRRIVWFDTPGTGPLGCIGFHGYRDEYFCVAEDEPFWYFCDEEWRTRDEIEKRSL